MWTGRSQALFINTSNITQRRQWHPTPALLPGKSLGQRSLVGCSPWGLEESDMTERLPFHFSLSCIGEGNGNPLQCSCLENPRDGGAWWAAVYGVAQSDTTEVTQQQQQQQYHKRQGARISFILYDLKSPKQVFRQFGEDVISICQMRKLKV